MAIDEHSRVGFSLMPPDETAQSACQHQLAALRYYKVPGVKAQRVMTDNGPAYKSKRFAKLLRRLKIKHLRTRLYTPRTNGKAGRFIQTLLREWACACRYPASEHRARELVPWMHHDNFHRLHSAAAHKPPATRLGFDGNNVLRNDSYRAVARLQALLTTQPPALAQRLQIEGLALAILGTWLDMPHERPASS